MVEFNHFRAYTLENPTNLNVLDASPRTRFEASTDQVFQLIDPANTEAIVTMAFGSVVSFDARLGLIGNFTSGGRQYSLDFDEGLFNNYNNPDLTNLLDVTKTSNAPAAGVSPGDTVTYTVTVENISTNIQSGVSVSDVLPTDVSYISGSTSATGPVASRVATEDIGPVAIPDDSDDSTATCNFPVTRTVNVAQSFTISDVDFGFNASHGYRGALRLRLASPTNPATFVTLIAPNLGNSRVDFDLLLDDASANPIDDGNNDTTASPFYDRTAAPSNALSAFNGQNSAGTWTIEICDIDTYGDNGTYNRSQLILKGSTTTVTKTNQVAAANPLDDGVPPNLVTANDSFTLAPNETLTVTFQVQVDNPLTPPNIALTNPVTLRSFYSTQGAIEGDVIFEWATATEVGNLGFDLYVKQGGQWVRINEYPIASPVIDSLEVTDYTYVASGVAGGKFRLVDIDIYGKETGHGPFKLGKRYGQSDSGELIDWKKIKHQNKDKKKKRKQKQRNQLRNTPKEQRAINLQVTTTGIHRVTYEQLLEAGLDLQGIKIKRLALLNRGEPVPMWVEGENGQTRKNIKFGPGGAIEFLGHGLDSLYTKTNVYTLKIKNAQARRITPDDTLPATDVAPASHYMETITISPETWYSFASPNGDPWFAEQLLAWGGPYNQSFDIHIDEYLAGAAPATVSAGLWGVTDWPSDSDHLQVGFNGVQLDDAWFDGLMNYPVSYALPAGTLQEGQNSLSITLPLDTGEIFDLVNIDHWQVSYPRRFIAKAGQLTFSAARGVFAVEGLSNPDVVVYRVQADGNMQRLTEVEVVDLGGSYQAWFPGTPEQATYYVVGASLFMP